MMLVKTKISMKNLIYKTILIAIGVLIFSCATKPQANHAQIIQDADSIRKAIVDDKRLVPYIFNLNENSKTITIETNDLFLLANLEDYLSIHYPKYKIIEKFLPDNSVNGKHFGIINLSVGNMRSAPKHSAELVTQALLGTPVKVYKKIGNWVLIQTPDDYIGWIDSPALALKTKDEVLEFIKSKKIIYTAPKGFLYKLTDKNEFVSDIVMGNIIEVLDSNSGFLHVQFPDGRRAYLENKHVRSYDEWVNDTIIDKNQLVDLAKIFVGIPYMWGAGSSKSTDCSGFTKYLFFMNGIVIQRDASQQILYGESVKPDSIFSNLEKGDLLFFGYHKTDSTRQRITHVGMYIGNSRMIHASGKVRINSLNPSDPDFDAIYHNMYIETKRYINSIGKERIETAKNNKYYNGFKF